VSNLAAQEDLLLKCLSLSVSPFALNLEDMREAKTGRLYKQQ